jgi:hypothetical protein
MMQGALHVHAQAVRLSGGYEEAALLFERSLHNLGHVEIHRGNVDAAAEHFAQVPHSDDDYGRAMANLNDAQIAFAGGDVERAGDDRFELDWLREQLECAAN